jgi:N,N'-diacetylbacillosaminyl-diphospho-undecaprenol alpha-1,3-N-acetylgalactosaminyltransferase
MTLALVCPDGFSILLFCRGIIAELRRIPGARVLVVTDPGEHSAEIEALGVRVAPVPISRFIDPLADLRYVRDLRRVFRDERCDVVLNFSTKPNLYGAVAARLAGVPHVISHVVGLGASFLPSPSLAGRAVQAVVLQLYRHACRTSRHVWFTNRNDLAFFDAAGLLRPGQAVLTRNYLDTSEYAPGIVPEAQLAAVRRELALVPGAPVVVMVARLIWPKGIREFADAAAILKDRHPDATFLLVAPPEPPSVNTVPESYVRGCEKDRRFRWLGFRRDVKALYALGDVAVLPSYYKEGGYPRALLEPMAMAKPIVTTTSDDCRGTVDEGRNGFLVPPADAAALAEAISRLLSDAALRRAFGDHSRDKATREFDEAAILRDAFRQLQLSPETV